MFSLTKARGYVDPDDSLLVYFMLVGFAAWILGIAALFVSYAPTSSRLGKTGLGISLVGIVLVAAGHLLSEAVWNATGVDLFLLIILGVLALIVGPLLFGAAALRRKTLSRRWRFVPLFIGLVGLMWIFSGSDDGSLTFGFMFFRTLFALGWFLMGYALLTDKRETAEKLSPQQV